jgi:hypothetical protein
MSIRTSPPLIFLSLLVVSSACLVKAVEVYGFGIFFRVLGLISAACLAE